MTELVVLSDHEVAQLVTFEETVRLIEAAFSDYSAGKSHVFPVVREEITPHQGVFGIKSGYIEAQGALGFKAGGFWLNNKDKGLANHQSVMVLFNPATGQPSALVAANYVTKIRTAALGAIGCKYLARPDSTTLAVIGTGQQGRNQLEATLKMLPSIETVLLYDAYSAAAANLAADLGDLPQKVTAVANAAEACRAADVIITAASSHQAIVMQEWIRPGTHINAVGTDTRGKMELDPQVFALADKIIVDHPDQCLYLGECQHAFDRGIINRDSIYATIGEIISGQKAGRQSPSEITVFDTTGVAIQDLATAEYALSQALARGLGRRTSI